MKIYKITKIIEADSIGSAIKNEKKADLVEVAMFDELEDIPSNKMGF